MATLRFALRFSYVFFAVLLIGTVLFYNPLQLTQNWLVAILIPAIVLAFAAFIVVPIFDWFRSPPEEKRLEQPWYAIYSVVLAAVMLVAPLSLASLVLEASALDSGVILLVTAALFAVNTLMVVILGYFLEEPGS